MTRDDALEFAASWIESWNRRDIERVLATFDDDIEFTSPTALVTVGVATVHGKQELRSYWQAALARIASLRFALDRALWDPESRELAIIYVSEVNGAQKWVSENFRFGTNGKVSAVDVFHGVARQTDPALLRSADLPPPSRSDGRS
ncbi:MAG: nuclear transport factor 2 family protein [Rhodoglobus sp.]|nr:nuclear transport factor 2 family protein [Rhodoglobus sp.]